jgi:curli biogenesis system outer membrane secretion channel CsgG
MRVALLAASLATIGLTACVSTPMNVGSQESKTTATGAAGGATAVNANPNLERCDRPVGTTSFIEDTNAQWYSILTTQHKLPSTTLVLRMLAQQSNCFVVVERGRGFAAIQGERNLERSGELRQNSNFGKGQLAAADYAITPSITFSANDTGGVRGGLAGVSGRLGVLGAVAGGVKTKEASTMLALTDNRSGIQVAIAEGSASRTDFDVGTALFGRSAAGSLGAYQNTPEGKVLIGAFTDAFNQLVKAVKNYTPQEAPAGSRGLGTGGSLKTN